jgi:hypothetical protein
MSNESYNPRNLTTSQVEHIQFEEGLLFRDYGLPTQEIIAPTRGGGEFTAKVAVRDIEYDGRVAKAMGMQVIESMEATLKLTTICSSQENLRRTLPNLDVTGTGDSAVLSNPKEIGVVKPENYAGNITMFARLIGGHWKKITLNNAMNEADMGFKAVPKSENELGMTIYAHINPLDTSQALWTLEEVPDAPAEAPTE